MPGVRDHDPFVIEHFGGLWARGDAESCPSDHFTKAENVQYFTSGIETRDALDPYLPASLKVLRQYDYVMQTGQSILVLFEGGLLYHIIPTSATLDTSKTPEPKAPVIHGPILNLPAMEDFGFVAIAGRAYITPFKSVQDSQGINYEIGLSGQFLYVYNGDGTPARRAGGAAPVNGNKLPFLAYNSESTGEVSLGLHVIGVAFNGGVLGPIEATFMALAVVDAPGDKQIQLTNIPIGPGGTTGRNIVMTKVIPYDKFYWDFSNSSIYTYYVATDALNTDNTITSLKLNVKDELLVTPFPAGATPAAPTTGALTVFNGATSGHCDFGFHLVGVVYETDSGHLSAPGPEHFGGNTYVNTNMCVTVANIPISPNSFVKKRHLVSTKAIPEYNGDQKGYQFFFIPGGTLNNAVPAEATATVKSVSYYDSDLLSDASHLIDNFAEIPAGVNLTTYHSRLVLVGDGSANLTETGAVDTRNPDNRSIARLSAPGEPEAISKVDGLIIAPLDGNPLTNCQEFRDILYLFKRTRTYGYSDNGDEPATWQEDIIDQGVGAPVHGVATVLDTGGVNVDYLLIADWSGLMLFNGTYARPEMSWKIEDYWMSLNRNNFRFIQIVNDSLGKKIWMTLPTGQRQLLLHADYGEGLDAKNIKWAKWKFDIDVTSICLIESNKLILGSGGVALGMYFINPAKLLRYDTYYPDTIVKIPDPTIRTALFGE